MLKYVFGITGGTGVGKSTVSDMFRKKGIFVCDCDKIARGVVLPGTPCLAEIKEKFGNDVMNSDGTMNRRKMASVVFTDDKKLELLNGITHKYIKECIENELERYGTELSAVDGAVLIGSPVMELCESLVVVAADEDERLKRIKKRDGIDDESAKNRIESQKNEDFYLSHADYVIENNGGLEELGVQIEQVYSELKSKAEGARTKA